jgi:hypothetical protein
MMGRRLGTRLPYVGDVGNNRVQRFSSTGSYIGQWPLSSADGIAVAPGGTVYVTSDDRIHAFSPAGGPLYSWGGNGTGNG